MPTLVSLSLCLELTPEIAEDVGEENAFLFGYLAADVEAVRYANSYNGSTLEERSPELFQAFKAIESGTFGDGHVYEPLLKTVSRSLDPTNDSDIRPRLLPRLERLLLLPRSREARRRPLA